MTHVFSIEAESPCKVLAQNLAKTFHACMRKSGGQQAPCQHIVDRIQRCFDEQKRLQAVGVVDSSSAEGAAARPAPVEVASVAGDDDTASRSVTHAVPSTSSSFVYFATPID